MDRIIAVRLEYSLTIDRTEADAIDAVLATCDSTDMVLLAPTISERATAKPTPTPAPDIDALDTYGDKGTAGSVALRPEPTVSRLYTADTQRMSTCEPQVKPAPKGNHLHKAPYGQSHPAYNTTEKMADHPLNAVNRGVYISDNLPFLKTLNDECIDLVCIDPPFAKNETFGRKNSGSPDPLKPPLTEPERKTELALLRRWGIRNDQDAAKAGIDWPETRYKDIWSWQDIHEEWLKNIEHGYPSVHKLIDATQEIHGEGTAAYLCYMAVRLFEIHRVLKETGSLYLHCDHTAGAYLRQLLDAIFGKNNFRNEVVWCYTGPGQAKRWFPRKHDTILFFAKSDRTVFNADAVRRPFKATYTPARGIHGTGIGEDTQEKRNIHARGTIPTDWWADGHLSNVSGYRQELTGYPTQKPVALAERIIKASCLEDGIVLDCFAGCAYVAVAAERLNRNWLACDINPRAWTVFKRQFTKPKLALLTCAEPTQNAQPAMLGNIVTVHGPNELPVRETPEHDDAPPAFQLQAKPRTFKTPASIIPEPEMLEILLEMSGYQAWCCGFANRLADGSVIRTTRNFHLDHREPRSKDGTSDQIVNRAPLCPYHNIVKSNRRLHLAEYREEIAIKGEMMVNDISELINLSYAFQRTMDIYSQRQLQKAML